MSNPANNNGHSAHRHQDPSPDNDTSPSPGFNTDLFTGPEPLNQLNALIEAARQRNATRLLLLAGKPILCRINGQLSDPIKSERLHFRQTQALVHTLLTEEQTATLDTDGAIEIDYHPTPPNSTPTDGTPATNTPPLNINIFYGDGAHNLIVFLD